MLAACSLYVDGSTLCKMSRIFEAHWSNAFLENGGFKTF